MASWTGTATARQAIIIPSLRAQWFTSDGFAGGAMPAEWFPTGYGQRRRVLRGVLLDINGSISVEVGRGAAGDNFLDDIRDDLVLTIEAGGHTLELEGIGGDDSTDVYDWTPDNAADVTAFVTALGGAGAVGATFTIEEAAGAGEATPLALGLSLGNPLAKAKGRATALQLGLGLAAPTPVHRVAATPLALGLAAGTPRARAKARATALQLGLSFAPPVVVGEYPDTLRLGLSFGTPLAPTKARATALALGLSFGRPAPALRVDASPLPLGLSLGEPIVLRPAVRFARTRRETAPEHELLTALEITHPAIATPVRVINDTEDAVIEGETYTAVRFDAVLAGHEEGQAPRAELQVDNVGRELNRWVEITGGGAGAGVRVMQLVDGATEPDWEVTMEVLTVNESGERVTAALGFDALLGRPAVRLRFDPERAPGLF